MKRVPAAVVAGLLILVMLGVLIGALGAAGALYQVWGDAWIGIDDAQARFLAWQIETPGAEPSRAGPRGDPSGRSPSRPAAPSLGGSSPGRPNDVESPGRATRDHPSSRCPCRPTAATIGSCTGSGKGRRSGDDSEQPRVRLS